MKTNYSTITQKTVVDLTTSTKLVMIAVMMTTGTSLIIGLLFNEDKKRFILSKPYCPFLIINDNSEELDLELS